MSFSPDLQFDILTLVNEAQPSSILLISEHPPSFLNEYHEQRHLINMGCEIKHLTPADINTLFKDPQRYDLALLIGALDDLEKSRGAQLLAHCRDLASSQYCLTINHQKSKWKTVDLFAFAMSKVSEHSDTTLYKYSIDSYKRTPDWLNADNWANPALWNKYRW